MTDLSLTDLLSRSGHLLWRELPEEYRYRDEAPPGEPGDLAMFLHGMGHLLDLIRGTTEQLYADSFAEAPDAASAGGRAIQPWLLPYLAELTGTELAAPDPANRLAELNNSVRWYKAKGTLSSVDEVGDVVTGLETVAREGWRQVLACPRVALPPFSLPPTPDGGDRTADGRRRIAHSGDPTQGADYPLGTPDLRRIDRPVRDPGGTNPLFRLRQPRRDAKGLPATPDEAFWRPLSPGGVPCFQGSYGDSHPRTPDLRDGPRSAGSGPHPRRTHIHVRPPDGMFAAGLRVVELAAAKLTPPAGGSLVIDPTAILRLSGSTDPAPDRLVLRLTGDLRLGAGRSLVLQDVLIVGRVTRQVGGAPVEGPVRVIVAPGARLTLLGAAAEHVVLEGMGPQEAGQDGPALVARNSLFGRIGGGTGFARLEYCTVTGETDVTVLQASDCLLHRLSSNLSCSTDGPPPRSCLRHSRAEPAPGRTACLAEGGVTNTTAAPHLSRRWSCPPGGTPVLALPGWGEPGHGVLSSDCPPAIARGAEDGGEMGAHHHLFLSAGLDALSRKLSAFLPIGQEIALFHDPFLALLPPEVKEDTP